MSKVSKTSKLPVELESLVNDYLKDMNTIAKERKRNKELRELVDHYKNLLERVDDYCAPCPCCNKLDDYTEDDCGYCMQQKYIHPSNM